MTTITVDVVTGKYRVEGNVNHGIEDIPARELRNGKSIPAYKWTRLFNAGNGSFPVDAMVTLVKNGENVGMGIVKLKCSAGWRGLGKMPKVGEFPGGAADTNLESLV